MIDRLREWWAGLQVRWAARTMVRTTTHLMLLCAERRCLRALTPAEMDALCDAWADELWDVLVALDSDDWAPIERLRANPERMIQVFLNGRVWKGMVVA